MKNCEECNTAPAKFVCTECEENLCEQCDHLLHRGGSRKSHRRSPLCQCGELADQICSDCSDPICETCSQAHPGHLMESISRPTRLGVFWDLTTCRPQNEEEIQLVLNEVLKFIGKPELIHAYGGASNKWRTAFEQFGIEVENKEDLKETHALLLDLSVLGSQGLSHALIICGAPQGIKPHLDSLCVKLPSLNMLVSTSLVPLNPVRLELIPVKTLTNHPKQVIRGSYSIEEPPECPYSQFFPKKKGQDWKHENLIEMLKEEAEEGNLVHKAGLVALEYSKRYNENPEMAANVIKTAENLGLVNMSEREFSNIKAVVFVSIRIESMSLESLFWILQSLRIDEMLPTERAIQSRMKEVFDFKPTPIHWDKLLEAIKKQKHSHSLSNPIEPAEIGFSLFSNENEPKTRLEFSIKDFVDPVTGSETHLIFPRNEEWESIDQYIKEGDVLEIKGTEDWKEFTKYLKSYFELRNNKIDESRAIPGGRYGCAEFLKICGPPALNACSLGKLSYMVELAIYEDLLRYQKTLLVWTTQSKKEISETSNHKLVEVQNAIVSCIRESKTGMSLAQLPMNLKRKLSYPLDLSELGFAKLKDLLSTMPEIEIELRGTNHPFAVLSYMKNRKKSTSGEIKKAIEEILSDENLGLPGARVELILSSKLGKSINWNEYKCSTIYEFVRKNGSADFDVISNGESKILIKSVFRKTESEGIIKPFSPFHSETSSATSDSNSFMVSHKQFETPQQESGFFDFEQEQYNRFIDELLHEDDLSTSYYGPFPPHYRTDSVEYHSSETSRLEIQEGHYKAMSEDLSANRKRHTREVRSYYEGAPIEPPPGFSLFEYEKYRSKIENLSLLSEF